MRKTFIFILYISISLSIFGQEKVLKDLDGDSIKDTIYIEDSRIVCRLSTHEFKKIESKEIEKLHFMSGIDSTETGFSFSNHRLRGGGYIMDFKYEPRNKKIRLIKMYRYEYGDVENYDGNGKSTLNLLTNEYIGDWEFYNYNKDSLFTIPTIHREMYTNNRIYLEDFSDEDYFEFADKCSTLWWRYAAKMTEPIEKPDKPTHLKKITDLNQSIHGKYKYTKSRIIDDYGTGHYDDIINHWFVEPGGIETIEEFIVGDLSYEIKEDEERILFPLDIPQFLEFTETDLLKIELTDRTEYTFYSYNRGERFGSNFILTIYDSPEEFEIYQVYINFNDNKLYIKLPLKSSLSLPFTTSQNFWSFVLEYTYEP